MIDHKLHAVFHRYHLVQISEFFRFVPVLKYQCGLRSVLFCEVNEQSSDRERSFLSLKLLLVDEEDYFLFSLFLTHTVLSFLHIQWM